VAVWFDALTIGAPTARLPMRMANGRINLSHRARANGFWLRNLNANPALPHRTRPGRAAIDADFLARWSPRAFDAGLAAAATGAGGRFKVELAITVGRRGDPASLPQALQAREAPSPRLPLEQLVFAGQLPA